MIREMVVLMLCYWQGYGKMSVVGANWVGSNGEGSHGLGGFCWVEDLINCVSLPVGSNQLLETRA